MKPTLIRALAVCAVVTAFAPAASARRLVAIGDIHGAYQPLVEILGAAGLVDDKLAWSGGDATLIQLGDFTDRGAGVRSVMDLLMRLQEEAPAAGGRVIVLMGNHEALNVVGELRDASQPALLEFKSEADENDLEEEYHAAVKAARLRARLTGGPRPVFDDAAHQSWLRAHPPGTLAYLRAIAPDGRYGKWLRGLPAVVLVDGVLFLHGGLDSRLAETPPDAINQRVREEITALDECRAALGSRDYLTLTSTTSDLIRAGFSLLDNLRGERDAGKLSGDDSSLLTTLERCDNYENWHLFSPSGPLWFRGYAEPPPERSGGATYGWTEEEGTPLVAHVLAEQGARHAVVAHTPRVEATIKVRFGGRVFLIDTGMLAEVYDGRPSALEIDQGVFTAIYLDRREELWNDAQQTALPPTSEVAAAEPAKPGTTWRWMGPNGEPLPFRTPDELEDFLRTAEIVSTETIDTGTNRPLKVLVERDGVEAHAVFRSVSVEERSKQGPVDQRGPGAPRARFYRLFRDNFAFECAAYELASVLGLDRVPPAVPRTYGGREGSLQAWVENAITETKRLEEGTTPPDILRWAQVVAEKQVFDALVNNLDPNTGNMLIDRDWNVWWIDHTRAFQIEYGDEPIAELRRLTPELWNALRTVERDRVRTMLQPFLRPSELDALFERWDQIVLHFRTLIADNGLDNVVVGY